MSSGWTFSVDDYSKSELPKMFCLKTLDAILQWNEWWTRSYIEIGGDASASKTAFCEKIFLIFRSGYPSRLLEKIMLTPKLFMRTIRRRPKSVGFQDGEIWFYIPSRNSLCQPSLCCHAVLTVATGPSLVTSWEAIDETNVDVARITLAYYVIGARKGTVSRLLSEGGVSAAVS